MKVTIRHNWFAASEPTYPDALRVFSGRLYRPGVYLLPDDMLPHLPKDAIVEQGPVSKESKVKPSDWRLSADQERAALESLSAAHAEADQKLANKRAGVAKAREAKALKAALAAEAE